MEDQLALENQEEKIFKLIHDDNITTIILSGDLGVGKTWMARKLSERAIKSKLFDTTLWFFLNKKYRVVEVYENIAHQLSLLDSTKEWEHDDDNDHVDDDGINDVDMEVKKVKSLTEKINSNLAEKRLLIILDDEGYKMDEDEIIEMLRPLLHNGQKIFFKVLITTRRKTVGTQQIQQTEKVIDIQTLTEEESISLFKEKAAEKASVFSGIQEFPKAIANESKGVPALIVAIAGVLRNFEEVQSCLDEAANNESYDIKYLLSSLFGLALNDDNSNDLISCFWHCKHLLRTHRGIHFNVLIAHWMIEGYLGSVDNIVEAYWKGHRVLMKLMDRGILTIQTGNDIIMEGAALDIFDCRRHGFHATASLGLGGVIDAGLGVISMRDGMMGTSEKWKKSSILMLDGNHLRKELPNTLSRSHPKSFQQLEVLQVLVLFNPRLKSLPLPLSNMKKLRVLVLRNCHLLEEIDFFKDLARLKSKKDKLKLKALTALEISGASSSLIIPDNIFQHMPKLGSLNLSSLKITSLPSSILHLGELRWLVLRGCSELAELPMLKQFRKLEVLDLSGCRSLTEIEGKSLRFAKKLRLLNLSQTQIRCLPSLNGLVGLTHLLLSECSLLKTLPDLKDLTSLQILDVSSSITLNEINIKSFNSKQLQILDLSNTAVTVLPSTKALVNLELLDLSNASNLARVNDKSLQHLRLLRVLNLSKSSISYLPSISNLNLQKLLLPDCKFLLELPELEGLVQLEELDLSGCLLLKELPHFNTLVKLKKLHLSDCSSLVTLPCLSQNRLLEVLDLSGCHELKVIRDESFEHMPCLQILDLSETKVESLPSLSNLTKLSHLKLKHCINLREIPQMNSLLQLEVLNLCGVPVPSLKLETEFLKHMTNLQMLDLSETVIENLPSMSNFNNLKELSLRGCSNLKTLSDLEALKKLDVLDLSGTGITCLPPLSTLSNLRTLMLTGCSGLDNSLHLEEFIMLIFMEKLPLKFSDLLHIKQLDLPAEKNSSSDHPYRDHWRISNNKRPLIYVNSAPFLALLERSLDLFDTSFEQFSFSIHPVEEGDKGRDFYLYGDELVFRNIYFKSRKISLPKYQCRYLEIRGFNNPPMYIDNILSRAAFVVLIENTFIRNLTDLGKEYIDMMKGCWIESCSKMDCVLPIKEEGKEEYLGRNLEILWISNLPSLRSIWSENLKPFNFTNLKSLYLDCCPMLTRVVFSSLPKHLEILEIKFCEKLVSVVEDDVLPESAECRLQNLRVLHLLDLPELSSIGFDFPSVQALRIEDCPNLMNLENSIKSSLNLETILVANVIDLRILCSYHLQPESFKMLKQLSIDTCSKLEYICSSYIQLESLEVLELKFCDNLKAIFEHNEIGLLPRLHTLNLWELPKLKGIACDMPSLQNQTIEGCPELQKFPLRKNSGIELP